MGPSGVGKTHLAVAALKELIAAATLDFSATTANS